MQTAVFDVNGNIVTERDLVRSLKTGFTWVVLGSNEVIVSLGYGPTQEAVRLEVFRTEFVLEK